MAVTALPGEKPNARCFFSSFRFGRHHDFTWVCSTDKENHRNIGGYKSPLTISLCCGSEEQTVRTRDGSQGGMFGLRLGEPVMLEIKQEFVVALLQKQPQFMKMSARLLSHILGVCFVCHVFGSVLLGLGMGAGAQPSSHDRRRVCMCWHPEDGDGGYPVC